MKTNSKRLKVIECNKSQTNPIKQTLLLWYYLFTLYFSEVKFVWVKRLRHTAHYLRLSSLVESHFIVLCKRNNINLNCILSFTLVSRIPIRLAFLFFFVIRFFASTRVPKVEQGGKVRVCLRTGFYILFEGRSCAQSTLVPALESWLVMKPWTKTNLKNKNIISGYPISAFYLLVWGVCVN